jgi:hypothetical protein
VQHLVVETLLDSSFIWSDRTIDMKTIALDKSWDKKGKP